MTFVKKIFMILFAIMFCRIGFGAQEIEDLPLHQKRLSEKALVVWTGDAMQTISVLSLATEKGLVVVDTSLIRSDDARIRKVIEKEFGRSDFKYLINTHYHHDHTAGNQVYSDAVIIGHKNVPRGMKSELTGEGLAKQIEKFARMLKEREPALAKMKPEDDGYTFMREFVVLLKKALIELNDGFIPTFPSITFEKNMMLDMGDMTVELYAMTGMHSDSDIAVFVPEEGIVAVGDVMPDRWPPRIRKEIASDFSTTLENWGRIVNSGREIKYVNMSHSDMYLSVETFKQQYDYLLTLWNGLSDMKNQGLALEDAEVEYSLADNFSYFMEERSQSRRDAVHKGNLEAIWDLVSIK